MIDRKEAIAAYRKREVVSGIYALQCRATGQRWVGYSPDMSTVQNRLRFTLRLGNHPSKNLQTAWNGSGDDGLLFETIERFEADEAPAGAALQTCLARWRGKLNALPA